MSTNFLATALLATAFIAVSCNKSKPVAEAPLEPILMHSGTVTLSQAKEGCPLLVRLDPQKTGEVLIPIGLDDKYQKEGLQLKFSYRPSRASSGECMKGTPAILEDITVIGQVQVPKQNLPTE
jgi:hypothetical protein